MTGVLIALEEAILDALAEDRTVQLDGVEAFSSRPSPCSFLLPGSGGLWSEP